MKLKKFIGILVAVSMFIGILPAMVLADDAAQEENPEIYEIVSSGIGSSEAYIRQQLETAHNDDGVCYGYEWYIIAMLRAGKTIDTEILDEYYASVAETVKMWNLEVKPTDAERTALALTAMGKDITDADGVNLAELIYNNPKLSDGSNELSYALIALDAADIVIPDDAVWSRESIIDGILSFQTADGAFGLSDNVTADIDMTAICMQALAPYQEEEKVKTAIDSALEYLKSVSYTDNVNSAAQILMATSILKLDATNEENGFGNAENNLVTTIENYRNPDGNGYMYEERVSSLATFQVMQAYDAYTKIQEGISYWDFSNKDNDNDENENENEEEPTLPDVESAEPANVYVTIVSDGNIIKDKNNYYVAQAPVTVTDLDSNGVLTVDEALYASHEAYYDGGAEAGYNSFTGTYGLSLGVLWGKGTPGTSAVASYWLNNASCWSLADEVKEGDYITAFNYYDTTYWSDSYSFFEENEAEAKSGSSVTLTLYAMGYDENWNSVSSPYEGAKVRFLEDEIINDDATTDENGEVEISLENVAPGSYYVVAYNENYAIVPTVCKINVTKKTTRPPSSSGGGGVVVNKKEEKADDDEKKEENDVVVEETPEIVDVKNVFTEETFSDIKTDSWYYDSVKYVYENNIMNGTEKGFEPESKMTRAMLVTVLYRMVLPEENEKTHSFTDVSSDEWYSDAVNWAFSNGIVNGMTETEFAPDAEITREQMAVIIYRFAKMQGYDVSDKTDISLFTDSNEISDWAIDAFGWANNSGIINGVSENILSPESTSTRAQVATIIMRFCENIQK